MAESDSSVYNSHRIPRSPASSLLSSVIGVCPKLNLLRFLNTDHNSSSMILLLILFQGSVRNMKVLVGLAILATVSSEPQFGFFNVIVLQILYAFILFFNIYVILLLHCNTSWRFLMHFCNTSSFMFTILLQDSWCIYVMILHLCKTYSRFLMHLSYSSVILVLDAFFLFFSSFIDSSHLFE